MATRTLIFTALPNGVSGGGKPQVSVHIAPRLVPTGPGDGQLQEFSEWTVWPNEAFSWRVVIGGLSIPATNVTVPAADAGRWSALFAPTTLVRARPGVEDFTGHKVRSYPVGNVSAHLRDNYVALATTSGDQHPDRTTLGPLLNPIAPRPINDALQTIEGILAQPPHAIGPGKGNTTLDFAQLKRFHQPSALRTSPIDHSQDVKLPKLDFHEGVSLAQDHPMLLRLLGLVVDLELDHFPDIGLPATTFIYVVPTANPSFPSGTIISTPKTWCTISGSAFAAQPSAGTTEVRDGYLRLNDHAVYGVVAVDQDGGGLKALDLSALAQRSSSHASVDTPTTFAVPVLRSRGLAIFQTGRALALHNHKLVRAKALGTKVAGGSPPGTAVTLYAEDVTQGYRFDTLDLAIGIWRSLSARTGRFTFTADHVVASVTADEATSNIGGTQAFDGKTNDLHIGEEIIAWRGWSVGGPRPAKAINNNDALMDESSQAYPDGFPIEIKYQVAPGSLPRLRFGRTYQFRGRAVDLAGNSLPLSDPSAAHASKATYFGRLDPVESPAILLRHPRGPSEGVDRVVLRSNYNTPPVPATNERHLLASKVAESTAELHGMFDTPSPASVVSINAYNVIAGREAKEVTDLPSAKPDPGSGGVSYFDVDHVRVPYLPDPVSAGALLRGVGGPVDQVRVFWDRGSMWADLGSVRVVMNEQPDPPTFPPFIYDPTKHQLDLYVAKADTLSVRLSTLPDVEEIRQFGLLRWILDAGLLTPALRADVEAGRNWMFTPFRPITFVHAVKQPLVPFTWHLLRPARQPNDTFATLIGEGKFSRKSTARIDLEASWDEYLDNGPGGTLPTRPDPSNPGGWLDRPRRSAIPISAPVATVGPVIQGGPDEQDTWRLTEVPLPGPRHEFHDTKHRDVDYPTRVFSRFDEYFRKDADINLVVNIPFPLDGAGIVKGSLRTTTVASNPTITFTEGTDYSVDLGAGTITKLPSASTAMINPVHASWVPMPNDRVGPPFGPSTNIPSATRPDAPKLVYVIPTLARTTSSDLTRRSGNPGISVHRSGPGVRVYIERPWWVTGGAEMLGVLMVASSPGQDPLPSDLARYATQWGIDPVHAGKATPDNPTIANFPLRVSDDSVHELPELPGVSVAVAGHAVAFDEARDLWYCDIDIDTGATYFPFVRLALTRWQPNSLGGLLFSPVVLADFVQLAADRIATVTPPSIVIPGTVPSWAVSISGPSYPTTTHDPRGLRARVTVQQRRAPGMVGPLAWDAVGSRVLLKRFDRSGPAVTFTGAITLPDNVAQSDLRVLFEEFEQIESDGWDPTAAGGPLRFGDRVVFADVVYINSTE